MKTPLPRWRAALTSPWWLAVVVAAVLLIPAWSPLERLDLLMFDLLAPRVSSPASADAVVVAIDDASLAALGPWPWSRATHAAMVERLRQAGATAVGYDVLLVDAGQPAADQQLADALRASGRVVLSLAPAPGANGEGVTPLLPRPIFADAARALGHIDVELDSDSVARRLYLEGGEGGRTWPALPLAVEKLVLGAQAVSDLPGRRAPGFAGPRPGVWQRDREVLLPHQTAGIPIVSFVDALRDDRVAAGLTGKAVFVGVTASGLERGISTTAGGAHAPMPAVQFLARSYAALRTGQLITPLGAGQALLLLLVIAAASALLAPRFSRRSEWVAPALVLLPGVASMALLRLSALWIDPLAGSLGMLLAYAVWRGDPLRAARLELARVRAQAHAAMRALGDGVISFDRLHHIRFANPAALRILQRENLQGLEIAHLFSSDPAYPALIASALQSAMDRRQAIRVQTELDLPAEGGGRTIVRATATPLFAPGGEPEGAVLGLVDVTDSFVAVARLDHEATHDALTGLPNRVLLYDRLRRAVALCQRTGESAALLFLDLDRFKRINDNLGHRQGDRILREVGDRLMRMARANDTVSRWGGDEFVLLLEGMTSREAVAMAARRFMEAVSVPLRLEGMELQIYCSVGIALAPDDETDPDMLLAMADAAMYRGKARTGSSLEFYSSEMSLWTRDWLEIEQALRSGLVNEEFELHYQPQVDLGNGAIVAVEALLRWRRRGGPALLPVSFIGVAEDCGAILEIGAWVIAEATRQVARWAAAGLLPLTMTVNVSPRQCLDMGIVRVVRGALQATGIDPRLLMLEISETAAMRDVDHMIELLHELRGLGVGIAIDDFGTGFSSVPQLRRLPIQQIKIDQSLVRDLVSDPEDATVVRAVIALAHSLELEVVAEGVENTAQQALLAAAHCNRAQGFHFGRAEPAMLVAERMKRVAPVRPAG